jgi:hypothetical protein
VEHILNSQTAGIDFTRYAAYVETIRHHLPVHVYAFASEARHFDLSSPSSLHDAWLETLTIRESASGDRQQIRRLEIQLCLLGPFHDRRIHLHYTGVTKYRFDTPSRFDVPRYEHAAHGDLLTHEIRLGHAGLLIHELLFERGTAFLIECADLRHSEEIIPVTD